MDVYLYNSTNLTNIFTYIFLRIFILLAVRHGLGGNDESSQHLYKRLDALKTCLAKYKLIPTVGTLGTYVPTLDNPWEHAGRVK